MAVNAPSRTIHYIPLLRIPRILDAFHIPLPRRRTVIATTLVLGGLLVAILMLSGIFSLSLWIGFIGFAMTASGGIRALIFCGEI